MRIPAGQGFRRQLLGARQTVKLLHFHATATQTRHVRRSKTSSFPLGTLGAQGGHMARASEQPSTRVVRFVGKLRRGRHRSWRS